MGHYSRKQIEVSAFSIVNYNMVAEGGYDPPTLNTEILILSQGGVKRYLDVFQMQYFWLSPKGFGVRVWDMGKPEKPSRTCYIMKFKPGKFVPNKLSLIDVELK